MPKLVMTKGLPGSGKSTWAKEMVNGSTDYVRVNKDDLRAMLFAGRPWAGKDEKLVLKIRDAIIELASGQQKSVIVDDTNLHPKHEQRLREIAYDTDLTFLMADTFLGVPVAECIRRDAERPNPVGPEVIRKQYNQFLANPSSDEDAWMGEP